MKKFYGLVLLITGIMLVGLSGLERIIIYVALHDRVGDYRTLKMITPNEIWNIATLTFTLGILLSIIGLIALSWKYIAKYRNEVREIEQGLKSK